MARDQSGHLLQLLVMFVLVTELVFGDFLLLAAQLLLECLQLFLIPAARMTSELLNAEA